MADIGTEPCPTNYISIDPKECCPKDATRKELAKLGEGGGKWDELLNKVCKACLNRIRVAAADALSRGM